MITDQIGLPSVLLPLLIKCFIILFYTAEEDKRELTTAKSKGKKTSMKSGAGTLDIYISSWVYYDTLDAFLKDQVVPRKSLSNLVGILQHLVTPNNSEV